MPNIQEKSYNPWPEYEGYEHRRKLGDFEFFYETHTQGRYNRVVFFMKCLDAVDAKALDAGAKPRYSYHNNNPNNHAACCTHTKYVGKGQTVDDVKSKYTVGKTLQEFGLAHYQRRYSYVYRRGTNPNRDVAKQRVKEALTADRTSWIKTRNKWRKEDGSKILEKQNEIDKLTLQRMQHTMDMVPALRKVRDSIDDVLEKTKTGDATNVLINDVNKSFTALENEGGYARLKKIVRIQSQIESLKIAKAKLEQKEAEKKAKNSK